jgi:phage shock protein E
MQNYLIWGSLAVLAAYLFLRPAPPAEARLSPQALRDRLAAEAHLQLVDVRTPQEFAEGHLKGAKNIPLDSLEARLGELAKDQPLALYCRSGRRSATALGLVHARGFEQAQHLEGGILAWQQQGLPLK